ncbi:glycoside hydrolase family 32 protein [Streptomyces sp. 130]|nr:glycoside hydrolase family 32 protein [Streptomyces sp. 130]
MDDREPRPSPSEPAAVPVLTPDPDAFRDPPEGRQALDGATVRRVEQVSLGAGIALVGLGLGFLALRMRRAR